MKDKLLAIVLVALVVWLVMGWFEQEQSAAPTPQPAPKAKPAPKCPDSRCPVRPRWDDLIGASIGGRLAPDGEPIQIDYPGARHLANKGGSDGSGLCVFTSGSMAGDWAGLAYMYGFRDWMTQYPGGGWPDKLDKMLAAYCAEKGVPVPDYVQIRGLDLPLVQQALAAGHMVCSTYYRSPTGRYGGAPISHMVNVVHGRKGLYGILDNNYPGAEAIEYLTDQEYTRASGGKSAWLVIFLRNGPPPIPRNQ